MQPLGPLSPPQPKVVSNKEREKEEEGSISSALLEDPPTFWRRVPSRRLCGFVDPPHPTALPETSEVTVDRLVQNNESDPTQNMSKNLGENKSTAVTTGGIQTDAIKREEEESTTEWLVPVHAAASKTEDTRSEASSVMGSSVPRVICATPNSSESFIDDYW